MVNCLNASKRLLESLRIPFTLKFLKEKILTHPHYPSLLSIADTLEEYGLESLSVKLGPNKLDDIPLPCIVQVSLSNGSFFFILTEVSEDRIKFFNEKGESRELPRLDFLKIWTGIGLIVEGEEGAAEPGIIQKIHDQRILTGLLTVFAFGLLVWLVFGLVTGWNHWLTESNSGPFLIYFSLKLIGLSVSGILLWYQQDRSNSTLQKFCSGGKRVDCDEVLNSKAFQLLEGRVNPGIMSFSYFFAGLGLLISYPLSSVVFLSWLSLVTIPVVLYSLYYQAMVLRKWCRFCLVIQGVLAFEVAVLVWGGFWTGEIAMSGVSLFLFLFAGMILGGVLIKPMLGQQEEIYEAKRNLAKLKSNKDLFEAALSRSRKIKNEPDGIGILMKGVKPKYKVIKICNPYCDPCSRVHPVLESLFEKGNIDLQILFTPGGGDEQKEKTIRHLLALDGRGNTEYTRQALDEWYDAEKKEYGVFAAKYPMNGELELQHEKMRAMQDWCEKEHISHTPTLFINGYELPDNYKAEDLKYILN
jgi:hypothetical protein